jgi:hypothetical protein
MTTRTVYAAQNMTIMSCQSNYVLCPEHLATAVVQEVQKAQYTTVVPVGQTSFPTPVANASDVVGIQAVAEPAVAPTVVISNPVMMMPMATPKIVMIEKPASVNATTTAPTNGTVSATPIPRGNSTGIYTATMTGGARVKLARRSGEFAAQTTIPVATGFPAMMLSSSSAAATTTAAAGSSAGAVRVGGSVLGLTVAIAAFVGLL